MSQDGRWPERVGKGEEMDTPLEPLEGNRTLTSIDVCLLPPRSGG